MTVTGAMVLTRGGAVLALDQRISDALMNYAIQAAAAEEMAAQTWCRKRWKLADYEAKHVLRGNASKTVFERILKMRGPHCGWFVAIAVVGAVAGQELHEFLREQNTQAAKAAQEAHEHERLAAAAYRRLEGDPPVAGEVRRSWKGAREVGSSASRGVAR